MENTTESKTPSKGFQLIILDRLLKAHPFLEQNISSFGFATGTVSCGNCTIEEAKEFAKQNGTNWRRVKSGGLQYWSYVGTLGGFTIEFYAIEHIDVPETKEEPLFQ